MGNLVEVNRVVVMPWLCDQFGHMNVRWYAHHFDDAGFQLWSLIGMRMNDLLEQGMHVVVVRSETNFKKEAISGDTLIINAGYTGIGTKSLKLHMRMHDTNTNELCATYDAVEVFIETRSRRSTPVPDYVRKAVESNLVKMI